MEMKLWGDVIFFYPPPPLPLLLLLFGKTKRGKTISFNKRKGELLLFLS